MGSGSCHGCTSILGGSPSLAQPEVLTCTSWGAPIIWDGTFDPDVAQQEAVQRNLTVGLTVFAVGRYLEKYLERFLETAEQHFMVGQRVVYYVFTERPAAVPRVPLGPGRRLRVERVARERRWQDLSMARMRAASGAGRPSGPRGALRALHRRGPALQRRLRARGAGRVGGAAARLALPLAPAAAALRARRALGRRAGPRGGRLLLPRGRVRGQRGGPAAADGALRAGPAAGPRARPGGPLARTTSHLNKFFWLHKPAKLLSPEFCWSPEIGRRAEIRRPRLLRAPKEYALLRS
ncbi:hypothetical protein K5549_005696 [Capra hircus]|nr:hypothetical protein K5549_005696 [Capra hircus]